MSPCSNTQLILIIMMIDDVVFLQVVTKDGHIVAMEFCRTEQLDDGSWTIDDEQTVKLKADFVISAFGSHLGESDGMVSL